LGFGIVVEVVVGAEVVVDELLDVAALPAGDEQAAMSRAEIRRSGTRTPL
jgi:hypothetical protein